MYPTQIAKRIAVQDLFEDLLICKILPKPPAMVQQAKATNAQVNANVQAYHQVHTQSFLTTFYRST